MGRLSNNKKLLVEFLIGELDAHVSEILDRENFKNDTGLDPELIDEAFAYICKKVGFQ